MCRWSHNKFECTSAQRLVTCCLTLCVACARHLSLCGACVVKCTACSCVSGVFLLFSVWGAGVITHAHTCSTPGTPDAVDSENYSLHCTHKKHLGHMLNAVSGDSMDAQSRDPETSDEGQTRACTWRNSPMRAGHFAPCGDSSPLR